VRVIQAFRNEISGRLKIAKSFAVIAFLTVKADMEAAPNLILHRFSKHDWTG